MRIHCDFADINETNLQPHFKVKKHKFTLYRQYSYMNKDLEVLIYWGGVTLIYDGSNIYKN